MDRRDNLSAHPAHSRLDWDEYFVLIALFISLRSKDPVTKVGCVITNQKRQIVSTGYNGFTRGVDEAQFGWGNDGPWLDSKYPYVVHAEQNAILGSSLDLAGCTLYTTLFPCHTCAAMIVQKGINELVFVSDKYLNRDPERAAARILVASGIRCRQLNIPRYQELVSEVLRGLFPSNP